MRWIELLLERARSAFPELQNRSIYVIDQNRTATSEESLRARLGPVQILRFPVSEPHVVMTGHDHAAVLNLAVREIESDYLLIFDSDAHPVSPIARTHLSRLVAVNDAVLAGLGPGDTRSHPCFMLFGPAVDRQRLLFDEGQLEVGVDTGRMIYRQVDSMGLRAVLLPPTTAFGGRWGTYYLERSIYHHGSSSFPSNPDPRLQAQATSWRRTHAFYSRRVLAGRYELWAGEARVVDTLARCKRMPNRISRSLYRLRAAGTGGRRHR